MSPFPVTLLGLPNLGTSVTPVQLGLSYCHCGAIHTPYLWHLCGWTDRIIPWLNLTRRFTQGRLDHYSSLPETPVQNFSGRCDLHGQLFLVYVKGHRTEIPVCWTVEVFFLRKESLTWSSFRQKGGLLNISLFTSRSKLHIFLKNTRSVYRLK